MWIYWARLCFLEYITLYWSLYHSRCYFCTILSYSTGISGPLLVLMVVHKMLTLYVTNVNVGILSTDLTFGIGYLSYYLTVVVLCLFLVTYSISLTGDMYFLFCNFVIKVFASAYWFLVAPLCWYFISYIIYSLTNILSCWEPYQVYFWRHLTILLFAVCKTVLINILYYYGLFAP